MSTEVKVPDIGDFKEVEVIEVLVKPGDAISKEQSLRNSTQKSRSLTASRLLRATESKPSSVASH